MSDTDPTAPWFDFVSYCRCCESLNRPVSIGGFMRYRAYLREVGIL
jgi:hypothetical protein